MNDIGILVLCIFGGLIASMIVVFLVLKSGIYRCLLARFKQGGNIKESWYPAHAQSIREHGNNTNIDENNAFSVGFRQPRNAALVDSVSAGGIGKLREDKPDPMPEKDLQVEENERSLLENEKNRLLEHRTSLIQQFRETEDTYVRLLTQAVSEVSLTQRKEFMIDEICIVNGHLVCEVTGLIQEPGDTNLICFEVLCMIDGITEYSATMDMMGPLPRVVQAGIRKARREKAEVGRNLEESGFQLTRILGKLREIDKSNSVTPRTPKAVSTPENTVRPPVRHLVTPPKLRQPTPPVITSPINAQPAPQKTKPITQTKPKPEKIGSIVDVAREMTYLRNNGSSLDQRRRFFKSLLLKYHPDKVFYGETPDDGVFQFIQEKRAWFLS